MDRPDLVSNIIVQKFRELYWPEGVLDHYTLKSVLAAKQVPSHRVFLRTNAANFGRVHFFYNQLKAGNTLDPVEIDWSWSSYGPEDICLLDGHHRYVAYVFAHKKWMPATYSGPVDALRWLEGKSRRRPNWL